MRIPRQPRLTPLRGEVTAEDVNRQLQIVWEEFARVIDGLLHFGSVATGRDNMDGETLEHTSAAADTAFSLTHNLGRVPVGFIVVYVNKAAIIYDGGVAWTITTISLKSNAATTLLRVFVY